LNADLLLARDEVCVDEGGRITARLGRWGREGEQGEAAQKVTVALPVTQPTQAEGLVVVIHGGDAPFTRKNAWGIPGPGQPGGSLRVKPNSERSPVRDTRGPAGCFFGASILPSIRRLHDSQQNPSRFSRPRACVTETALSTTRLEFCGCLPRRWATIRGR